MVTQILSMVNIDKKHKTQPTNYKQNTVYKTQNPKYCS